VSSPVRSKTLYGPSCLGASLREGEDTGISFELSQTFCPGAKTWGRGLPDSKASFMTRFSTRRAASASLRVSRSN
jgi:hypothetical protein